MGSIHRRRRFGRFGGASAASAWTPLSVPDFRWVNANSVAGANGDPIAAWNDLSSHADMNFTASGGDRPILTLNKYNGKRALKFSDGAGGMSGVLSFGSLPFGVVAIYAMQEHWGGSYRTIQGHVNNWLVGIRTPDNSLYNGAFIISANTAELADINQVHVFAVNQRIGHAEFFDNNVSKGTNANNTVPGVIDIGNKGAFGENANCYLLDIIGSPTREITAGELTDIQTWAELEYAGAF